MAADMTYFEGTDLYQPHVMDDRVHGKRSKKGVRFRLQNSVNGHIPNLDVLEWQNAGQFLQLLCSSVCLLFASLFRCFVSSLAMKYCW